VSSAYRITSRTFYLIGIHAEHGHIERRTLTVTDMDWPIAAPIVTARLTLKPLRVEHAAEMHPVLDDPALHGYIGGEPPTADRLRERYAIQATGHSPDGTHGWLNWIVRDRETGTAVGTVQATLSDKGPRLQAEVAWVIGVAHQGRGYAKEAAGAMVQWLLGQGADTITAHIHPGHRASIAVATHLGLIATDLVEDGEIIWRVGPIAPSGT
jgi:RimJ/RimL family protein N-acetyltransferase